MGVSVCKSHCDGDDNCKGYVEILSFGHCETATTSSCSSGCTKYEEGSIGDLVFDNDFLSVSHEGCYIKFIGSIFISVV